MYSFWVLLLPLYIRELSAIVRCLMISIRNVCQKNTLSAQIPEKKDESIWYGRWIVFVEYLISRRLYLRWVLSFYIFTFPESLEKWGGWESLEHCLKELTTKLWHWLWNYYTNRIIRSYYSSMNWRSAGKSYLLISLFFHSWGIAVIVVSDQNYVKRMETWAVNKTLIFLTFCQS